MNSNATQGTAAGAYTGGGGIVIVLVWVLSLYHIEVPDAVTAALTPMLGYVIHFIAMLVIGRSTQPKVNSTPVQESPILTHI